MSIERRSAPDSGDSVSVGAVDIDGDSLGLGPESVVSIAEPVLTREWKDLAPARIERAAGAGERSAIGGGRYRVGAEIGAGGMGRVSLVRDTRLLRDIAWKQGTGSMLREARILAQLEHPGIVPIYDMGFDHDDRPFFAMRVVSGRSLAQVIRETPLHARSSLLRPVLQAAEAVAFAHHRGVVHRDLKPANVMIGRWGEVHVVDWGLARVLDDAAAPIPDEVRLALGAELGRSGTPGYMSPEQDGGREADRRSDVYALGRILSATLGASEDAPATPELAAIIARSVAVDPDERYVDAAAFAAELARYLDGARVQAHNYSPGALLRRFIKAYRVPLAVAMAGLIALGILAVRYLADVAAQRTRAESAEVEADSARDRSELVLSRVLVGEARRLAARGARPEAELLAAHALTLNEDPDARAIIASFGGAPHLELVSRVALPCPDAQADATGELVLCSRFDGVALWRRSDGQLQLQWRVDIPLHVAVLVPDGVVVASSSEIALLDLAGHVLLREKAANNTSRRSVTAGRVTLIEGNGISLLADVARRAVHSVLPCGGELHSAVLPRSDDGQPGLAVALCRDGTLRRGDVSTQTQLIGPERDGALIAGLHDGGYVVGTNKGEVVVLDASGGIVRSTFLVDGMVRVLAPSPDGELLLVAGEGESIVMVTLPELASIGSLPMRAKRAAWDPSRPGELVSTGAWLERWRVAPASSERALNGAYLVPLVDGAVSLDIEATTSRVAVAVGPNVAVLSPSGSVEASPGYVTVKAVSFDGAQLVVAGAKGRGTILLDGESLAWQATLSRYPARRLVTLRDGHSIVATYANLWRVAAAGAEMIDTDAAMDLSASPQRRFAVALRERDHALLRFETDDAAIAQVGFDGLAEAVAIADDGAHIFTARAGEVASWDDLGHLDRIYFADTAALIDVEVSGDGHWIAAGSREGVIYLWTSDASQPRARFFDHRERVTALRFAAANCVGGEAWPTRNCNWFVSGSWDRTLRVRDLTTLDAPAATLRSEISRRYGLELGDVLGDVALDARPISEPRAMD